MHFVHYPEASTTLLEVKQWDASLGKDGLLKMLNVPHFGRIMQMTVVVKKLLVLVHDGHLWIGSQRITIDGELIHRITGLPMEGHDPGIEFIRKHEDTKLAQHMKDHFGLTKGKQGYQTSTIRHQNIHFTAKILACKLMQKCRPNEVPAPIVSIAANCAEGYSYKWAEYIAKEFLEDVHDA